MTNSKKILVNNLVKSGKPNRNNSDANKSVTNARTNFPKLESQIPNKPTVNNRPTVQPPATNNNNKPATNNNNNKPPVRPTVQPPATNNNNNNKPAMNNNNNNNNNNKPSVRPTVQPATNNNNNNKPSVKPKVQPATNNNNKPAVNNKSTGFVGKLKEIYLESSDLVSNIIKLTTALIIILAIFLAVNLSLALSGHIQLAMMFLILAIVVFISGEVVLPSLLRDPNPNSNNMVLNIVSTIFFGTGTILLCLCVKKAYDFFSSQKTESPMILKKNKSARSSMVIPQNPEDPETVILYRSDNEDEGIEFTYNYWMLIDNYEYKTNEWKHILHKGNKEGTPNMCPGFWLHPNKNSMRVYFNTMKNMKEFFDIDNMPLKKWVCVTLTVKQRVVECFINGMLKKRHTLSSIPRQNFGELWINLFGGFDGYLSKVQYHRRALSYDEIGKLVKNGPSGSSCIDTGELPPYLDDDWWLNEL